MIGVGTGPGSATAPAIGPWSRPPSAERDAWAVLSSVDGLGPVGFAALLEALGSGTAILREATSPGGVERLAVLPARPVVGFDGRRPVIGKALASAIATIAGRAGPLLDRIRALGLEVVTLEERFYPHRLAAIELPPHVLFVLGDIRALDPARAVALVGTRRPTLAGRRTASLIAGALARVGATVVSGLAIGIDGAAHAATVSADGTTIAVIGGGHGRLYPRSHERLADRIVRVGGAVVSELPPDVGPTRGTFPRRNRVISGLSDATVVVEAPASSGALITASWALEQGRECFLVPGAITDPASAGCLSFLRDNGGAARIVSGIPQLLDDLGLIDHEAAGTIEAAPLAEATLVGVPATAARIARELVDGRSTVDELVAVTGLPVAGVLAALTLLEARGLVADAHGRYRPAGSLAVSETRAPTARSGRSRAP